jgi:hypothetical protein
VNTDQATAYPRVLERIPAACQVTERMQPRRSRARAGARVRADSSSRPPGPRPGYRSTASAHRGLHLNSPALSDQGSAPENSSASAVYATEHEDVPARWPHKVNRTSTTNQQQNKATGRISRRLGIHAQQPTAQEGLWDKVRKAPRGYQRRQNLDMADAWWSVGPGLDIWVACPCEQRKYGAGRR